MSSMTRGGVTARRVPGLLILTLTLAVTTGAGVADLNEAGKTAYARGEYATAERLFSQALTQAPQEPLLHYHRGVALMRLGRWREARTAFEATLRLNPPPDVTSAAQEGLRTLAPLLAERTASPVTRDESVVALRRVGGNWVADVRVNDSRTATFLVDTGAAVCLISPDLADALGIRPDHESQSAALQTIAGRSSGPVVRISSLRVGDAEAANVIAVIHPAGSPIEGILGNTFLSRFTVILDPRRGTLHLQPR